MINGIKPLEKSLRWGMVGGGGTSQIGYIHRSSALRDHTFTLVAGAFDIDAARGRAFGEALGFHQTGAMPTTKLCLLQKDNARTVFRPSPSPHQTTRILLSAAPRLKRDFM